MFRKRKEHSAKSFTGIKATEELNRWLKDYHPKIVNTVQSGHGETLTIMIIYIWD